jgi:general secretion pathway protein G
MKRIAFTLVEVLIVVIVLGILAAIVVPQFSNAATDSNLTALKTNLQIVRGQLQLYKIQHGDTWPTEASFPTQMTGNSDVAGATGTGASYPFGPYLQSIPNNPYTNTNTVGSTAVGTTAWYYDATTGTFRANDSAPHGAY